MKSARRVAETDVEYRVIRVRRRRRQVFAPSKVLEIKSRQCRLSRYDVSNAVSVVASSRDRILPNSSFLFSTLRVTFLVGSPRRSYIKVGTRLRLHRTRKFLARKIERSFYDLQILRGRSGAPRCTSSLAVLVASHKGLSRLERAKNGIYARSFSIELRSFPPPLFLLGEIERKIFSRVSVDTRENYHSPFAKGTLMAILARPLSSF